MHCLWRPDEDGGLQSTPSAGPSCQAVHQRYRHGQVLDTASDGQHDLVCESGGGQRME